MRSPTLPGIAILVATPLLLTGIAAVPAAAAEPSGSPSPLTDRLVEAAEDGAATPDQIAEELSLPAEGGGSLTFDDEGRVTATVMFEQAPDDGVLGAVAEFAEVDRVLELFRSATVRVAPDQIPSLSRVAGVLSVTPAVAPFTGIDRSPVRLTEQLGTVLPTVLPAASPASTTAADACGPIPIEAAAPLHVDTARAAYGEDGSGVTIGIISDSFDRDASALTDWADDVASGALPGAGNPCGYETPVEIVADTRPGNDEGRAMAQLVHGIAPGAKLLFADAGLSETEMAVNIARLADAGAQIIVDDITWPTEGYYQKTYISTMIEKVKADFDVAYFTSAGNSTSVSSSGPHAGSPNSSWQTTAYRATACPSWLVADSDDPLAGRSDFDCLDFDADPSSAVPFDTLQITDQLHDASTTLQPLASIGEAAFGVTTSYELRFYELDRAADSVTLLDRISSFGFPFAGLSGAVTVNRGTEVLMVMVRTAHDSALREPAVFLGFIRGGQAIAERAFMGDGVTDWTGESVFGHAGDGSGTSVASLDWEDPETLRPYSSIGPATQLFEPVDLMSPTPSARLAHPEILAAPHLASVDGTQTTFFGEEDEGAYRFFGTSAAAPNAAAVAALAKAYAPGISGADLTEAVIATARGTADGGPVNPYLAVGIDDENVFGAGIIDAERLLAAMPAPAPGDFVTAAITSSGIDVAWTESGLPDHYVISLETAGGPAAAAYAETSQLPAGTTSYTFTGLAPATNYVISLTAYNAAGDATTVGIEAATAAAPTPTPTPTPSPAPDPSGGGNSSSTNGSGKLASTGVTAWEPFALGAALLLLGAAGLLIPSVRRRLRSSER